VLCNRVLPADAGAEGGLLGEMATQQRGYYEQIHTTFAPLPVWDVPYRAREILGVDALAELGATIWNGADPTEVYHRGAPQELVKQGDGYVLRLPLPHVEMAKVGMLKKGDELFVEIGTFKRDIALPAVLAPLEATVARMVNGALEVTFTPARRERTA